MPLSRGNVTYLHLHWIYLILAILFGVAGSICMKFRDNQVWIEEGELLIVPRGVEHRPVADDETHVLVFERASTLNTGNVRNDRTITVLDRICGRRRNVLCVLLACRSKMFLNLNLFLRLNEALVSPT